MKRVAFCTFGCRLNQYDTETLRTLLERDGRYRTVPLREEADLYVVNTCSVTARADASARKAIRRLHAERPGARIVVTGCYAQRAPGDIAALPGVSLVLGARDKSRIAQEVECTSGREPRIAVSPIGSATRFLDVPISEMAERSRAFVKIQEGCDKDCSFCIVPQTRGPSRSRPPASVLDQVRSLVESGYREVVLTGVDVGDYGAELPGRPTLVQLIRKILATPGLERFRLSSIEPSTISDELVGLMGTEERFARHFHIPLQSGSDGVLERMNRNYSAVEFARLIRRIESAIPECGIGTDVICGFPGETDDDFRRTFDLLVELPVTYLHPFTYSVRPGSRAEALGDQVPAEVKKRRTRSLKRLSADKNRAFRAHHVGRIMPVLLEEDGREGSGRIGGWTDNYLRVTVEQRTAPGHMENVRITGTTDEGLIGERIEAGERRERRSAANERG